MADQTTKQVTTLTWTNPHGGISSATIEDTTITDLRVDGSNNGNIIYSFDPVDLEHLKVVITDILSFITPEDGDS